MSDVELTISAGRPEAGPLRLVMTLVVAALFSGFALAGVYQVTKPTIDANKARELRLGVFKVVPGSSQLQKLALRDGRLVALAGDEATDEATIHAAYDDEGRFLGYAITGEGPGFQDTIAVLYGYDPARRCVTGMHILQSRETPGLGDKIYKDEDFVANFAALAADPEIVLVKGGRSADNEVDAITGATISSQAVVRIINRARERWVEALHDEPPPLSSATPSTEGGDP